MFRIYAGKDNKPAAYSADNVPYVTKRSLSISLDGVNEGDFTMVFGFPGRTTQYLPSVAVEQIMTVNDPVKISIRDKALAVIDGYMRKDEQVKIQYAAKYASISNARKKGQREVLGLTSTNAVAKKKKYEEEFQKRVNGNALWKDKYGNLLSELESLYAGLNKYGRARDYFNETLSRIEAFRIGAQINNLLMAAEIAMDHHLGLTCDPIGGLVQEPCIERNSMGAMKAITAANLALESDPLKAKVSLDQMLIPCGIPPKT